MLLFVKSIIYFVTNIINFGNEFKTAYYCDTFLGIISMGEWAKSQIKSVIESLSLKINNKKIESLNSLLKDEIERKKITLIKREIKSIETESANYKEIEQTKCSSIISIVGEPVLYNSLMELYSQAFQNDETNFIQSQIDKLTKLLNK